ncbi:MAG: hypothetical protein KTR14_03990 [Vampirovibrio sp.]|nr:hypothetical protein [Vampirovibrio sp.]
MLRETDNTDNDWENYPSETREPMESMGTYQRDFYSTPRESTEGDRAINTFAKMIERMEDLVLAGLGIPLTPWTVVNGDKLVPLLDRIRETLPEEIRRSQIILERRDEVITDAQRKAAQILNDAKTQAESMLSESELMKAVQQEAERLRKEVVMELDALRKKAFEDAEAMKAQAYEEARTVREGADRYGETILNTLDKNLNEFQTVVHNGQRHLKSSRVDALKQLQQSAASASAPNRKQPEPSGGRYASSPGHAGYVQNTEANKSAAFLFESLEEAAKKDPLGV